MPSRITKVLNEEGTLILEYVDDVDVKRIWSGDPAEDQHLFNSLEFGIRGSYTL